MFDCNSKLDIDPSIQQTEKFKMGINKLLPLLESTIHSVTLKGADHYKVSARIKSDSPPRKGTKSSAQSVQDLVKHMSQKRRRCEDAQKGDGNPKKEGDLRYLRVGIDISTWISAACHGNGAELIDERHLSNFGRSELEQQQQQQQQHKSRNQTERDGDVDNTSTANYQQQISNFIKIATDSVVRKIKSIQYFLSPTVLIVLDGASPPIKSDVVQNRITQRKDAAKRRDEAITHGGSKFMENSTEKDIQMFEKELHRQKISSAKKAGASTSHLYSLIVTSILDTLRSEEIPFMVAPYESDGQLTYLSNKGYIDFIVSEDSDFIPYGAEAVLYKYKISMPYELGRSSDTFKDCTATAKLLLKRELGACSSNSFSLLGFTDVMIAMVCVASGCDYAPSLKGIGLVHARNAVDEAFRVTSTASGSTSLGYMGGTCIERTLSGLFARSYGNLSKEAKEEYAERFIKGLVLFRHPVVFDPILGKCVIAKIDSPDMELISYPPYDKIVKNYAALQAIVGELFDEEMAKCISEGWINPKIWELRNENETPGYVSNYFSVWKRSRADNNYQNDSSKRGHAAFRTDAVRPRDVVPRSIITARQNKSTSVVEFESPTSNNSENNNTMRKSMLHPPSQSTTGTNSASKPSTQGSYQTNSSRDPAVMSPDLLS